MFKQGQQLGPYTLIKELGRGAFGVVWLAEQRTDFVTTQIAAKLPLRDAIDIDEFRKEAQIWVQASGHQNVLQLITADIFSGQVLIASYYAAEGTLENWLRNHDNRTPSPDLALMMTVGILRGLRHLHSRGIIHRDLKPTNVLLQAGEPLIADFGLARVLRENASTSRIAGTPAYMAPEVWEDNDRSLQGDLWSVGVILHEMLSGIRPFAGVNLIELQRAIRKDNVKLPDNVPKDIRVIVEKALQKKKEHRFQSADEMIQAIFSDNVRSAAEPTHPAGRDEVWVKAYRCPSCRGVNPIRCRNCGKCFTCLGEKAHWWRKILFHDGYNCSSCSSEAMNDFAAG